MRVSRDSQDVDVPAEVPLRRPTARVRRTLCWAQVALGGLVVLAATGVGAAVDERVADHAAASPPAASSPAAAALIEVAPASQTPLDTATAEDTGSVSVGDGALAAVGTLIVGWTLTAAVGTIGRRRLDDLEDARWSAEWAQVEPLWSGRVR